MIERGNLIIDGKIFVLDFPAAAWNADRYERFVAEIVDRIASTRVGAIVLRHLRNPVMVVPFETRRGPTNAFASCFTGAGSPPTGPGTHRMSRGSGATSVVVGFTPGLFTGRDRAGTLPAGTHAFSPDCVLVHELVHAAEMIQGVNRFELVGSTATDIAPTCEHRAVRVANMYHAEVRQPLRGPYYDYTLMRSGLAVFADHGLRGVRDDRAGAAYRGVRRAATNTRDPRHAARLSFEAELVHQFFLDHPTLCGDLERIPRSLVWYNPFNDFWTETYPYVLMPAQWRPRELFDVPAWIERTA